MSTSAVNAQGLPPWNDPSVNSINRKELTSDFFAFESVSLAEKNVKNASNRFMSIEGDWKFHWVKNINERPRNFYRLNLDDSNWGTMPVPDCWKLNGYGDRIYVNIQYEWENEWENNPPYVKDQYYPYIRPQESGNKTQVRYWRILDKNGCGLEFYSDIPMECSSLNYLTLDLYPSDTKNQCHSGDLILRDFVSVHISQRQMGLECIDTWGS